MRSIQNILLSADNKGLFSPINTSSTIISVNFIPYVIRKSEKYRQPGSLVPRVSDTNHSGTMSSPTQNVICKHGSAFWMLTCTMSTFV